MAKMSRNRGSLYPTPPPPEAERLAETTLGVEKAEAYGMLDGIFQQALLGHQREPSGVHLDRLARQVQLLVPLMITPDS